MIQILCYISCTDNYKRKIAVDDNKLLA